MGVGVGGASNMNLKGLLMSRTGPGCMQHKCLTMFMMLMSQKQATNLFKGASEYVTPLLCV